MDDVYSNSRNKGYDETPRKKIRFGLTSVENTNKGEDYLESKSETFSRKSETAEEKSGKYSLNISMEEDEKLVDDSGISLGFTEDNEDESFEIRRIRGGLRLCQGTEVSRSETPNRKSWESEVRQSQFRGETQEVSESCPDAPSEVLGMDTSREQVTKNNEVIRKTPDRSLFKKVQEKLLYECNRTPKKPKKKFEYDVIRPGPELG